MTDEELYRAYLAGDEAGLRTLMERYGDSLTLYLSGYIHDLHDAEDLMIEAFARTARAAERTRAILSSYLRTRPSYSTSTTTSQTAAWLPLRITVTSSRYPAAGRPINLKKPASRPSGVSMRTPPSFRSARWWSNASLRSWYGRGISARSSAPSLMWRRMSPRWAKTGKRTPKSSA